MSLVLGGVSSVKKGVSIDGAIYIWKRTLFVVDLEIAETSKASILLPTHHSLLYHDDQKKIKAVFCQ